MKITITTPVSCRIKPSGQLSEFNGERKLVKPGQYDVKLPDVKENGDLVCYCENIAPNHFVEIPSVAYEEN
jgi:hypothetical protein